MINTNTFPSDLSYHDNFSDLVFLLYFWNGLHPQTLTFSHYYEHNIVSRYYAHFGKTLNISTANDWTFPVP